MIKKVAGAVFAVIAPAILLGFSWGMIRDASAASSRPVFSDDPIPARERQSDPDAPQISFIDSPTAQCVQLERYKDTCYIQWYALQVAASSPAYVISMTVAIDDRLRANYSGFFQSSMFVPAGFHSPGFRVACGPPGASGKPNLGETYPYILRARDSNGLSAANYGSVTCPADTVPVSSVNLSGPPEGYIGIPYPFAAATSPITATLPITYTWQATNQTSATLVQGLASNLSYTWTTPGNKVITVNASNFSGSSTVARTITIKIPKTFIPIVSKR